MEKITKKLIAPCGMDCGICKAHLREKNHCAGCQAGPTGISCLRCKMRNCPKRNDGFCFDCNEFPCQRLKDMDKRYRTKYGMSEIENLEFIRDHGIDEFVKKEQDKYQSAGKTFCVHDQQYY